MFNKKEYYKQWCEKNKERRKENWKKWKEKNLDKFNQYQKEYTLKNKAKRKEYKKTWDRSTSDKKYHKKNYKKIRKYLNEYNVARRKIDVQFNIITRLRDRLYYAFKRYEKGKEFRSEKYGINYIKIIEHLKPFPKDISRYHIDHIRPLCTFDLTDPIQVKEAFAPENHQWLLAKENISKGGKWENL